MNKQMTYVIKYHQGSGTSSQTLRGCSSQEEALSKFWSISSNKQNSKTTIVDISSYPS